MEFIFILFIEKRIIELERELQLVKMEKGIVKQGSVL